MNDRLKIEKELQVGGTWSAEARTWIQWNIPFGDTVQWGSTKQVKISIRGLEDFALAVAVAATKTERERQCSTLTERIRKFESEISRLQTLAIRAVAEG